MKKLLSILVVLIFICAVFMVTVQAESQTASRENKPGVTMTIAPIFTTFKVLAKVPDPALKAALKSAVGVSQSDSLYIEDIAKLSGVLKLNNLGIADLTGIQYCENIEQLFLNDNNISSVIYDVKKMSKLKLISLENNNFTVVPKELYNIPKLEMILMQNNPITTVEPGMKFANFLTTIHLANCELTSFPEEVLIPNLEALYLANNDIKEIPPGAFSLLYELRTLNVDNTGLTELPSSIYWSNIVSLSAANNNLTGISHNIDNMGYCEYLNLSGNNITSLPFAFNTLSKLRHLNVNYNALSSLPDFDPNWSKIELLYARANKITTIPSTLNACGTIKELDLTLNQITKLPNDFSSMCFDYCGLSFNYLNITPGSSTYTALEAAGGDVEYIPQIEPPKKLAAAAQENEITLSWNACPEGSFDAGDIEVISYSVYSINGSTEKLAELPPTALSYTHENLSQNTKYEYRVSVKYKIILGTRGSTRYRTNSAEVSVLTLPGPLQKPVEQTITPISNLADETVSSDYGDDTSAEDAVQDTATGTSATEQPQSRLPIWAIVLICFFGVLALSTSIFFVVRTKKKRNNDSA